MTTQTIATKLQIAEQDLQKAEAEVARLKIVNEKADRMVYWFNKRSNDTIEEIRSINQRRTPDQGSDDAECLRYRTALEANPVASTLQYLINGSQKFYPDATEKLTYEIQDAARKYLDKMADRAITEDEYHSILSCTEPFLGKYVQRMYDAEAEKDRKMQDAILAEEKAYAKRVPQVSVAKTQEVAETQATTEKKQSLLQRILRRGN